VVPTLPKNREEPVLSAVEGMGHPRLYCAAKGWATRPVDLLEKGVPLEEVSKLLGYESIKTAERHYAKSMKGRQDRLDSLVTGTWKKYLIPLKSFCELRQRFRGFQFQAVRVCPVLAKQ
jgi:hypothetical protein